MRASLFDVHHSLSHITFAVRQNLEPVWADVRAEWDINTHLSLIIECRGKDVQLVADRLSHGVLQGEYDYRFTVSYPTNIPPNEWTVVRAYPNMRHDENTLEKKSA